MPSSMSPAEPSSPSPAVASLAEPHVAHTDFTPTSEPPAGGERAGGPPGAPYTASQDHTYSEPSISKGTASKTTSGPMLATAAPTA